MSIKKECRIPYWNKKKVAENARKQAAENRDKNAQAGTKLDFI